MERRPFGPTKREVSILGQGTWHLERADRATAVAALRRGLDRGMAHIDTGEMFGEGISEEIVGRAIAGRRDDVFLVSKILPQHASRSGTIAACERSLARLNTDRLDLYLLNWRDSVRLEETIAGFEDLQRQGKILAWGVSNFDVPDLEAVQYIAGDGRLACNQVLYNLEERGIEHLVIPWCERHDVAVVGYSALQHGRFPEPRTPGGRVLQQIAAAHRATPRQVALRFLVRHPSVFAIPKASSPVHTNENAGAGLLRLTDAEIARIDAAFPLGSLQAELAMERILA